jgi:hypothetical protein
MKERDTNSTETVPMQRKTGVNTPKFTNLDKLVLDPEA